MFVICGSDSKSIKQNGNEFKPMCSTVYNFVFGNELKDFALNYSCKFFRIFDVMVIVLIAVILVSVLRSWKENIRFIYAFRCVFYVVFSFVCSLFYVCVCAASLMLLGVCLFNWNEFKMKAKNMSLEALIFGETKIRIFLSILLFIVLLCLLVLLCILGYFLSKQDPLLFNNSIVLRSILFSYKMLDILILVMIFCTYHIYDLDYKYIIFAYLILCGMFILLNKINS